MSGNPVENEIKIRVPDAAAAAALLESRGFQVAAPRVFEANNVYDLPGGELRARGCLLRLRLAGDRSTLTFKGAPIAGRHKARPETEVVVSEFSACDSILRQLGYTLTFRYEKYRTELRRPGEPGMATVDETPIGSFMELEGSPDWIDAVATELGCCTSEYITASYISLYFEQCRLNSWTPSNMVFDQV